MENENLKNIIEQYKRSVKSLDDEIELHKLNQSEHDKLIQKEKQYVKYFSVIHVCVGHLDLMPSSWLM